MALLYECQCFLLTLAVKLICFSYFSRCKEESNTDSDEVVPHLATSLENAIISRLCLCTQKTKYFVAAKENGSYTPFGAMIGNFVFIFRDSLLWCCRFN